MQRPHPPPSLCPLSRTHDPSASASPVLRLQACSCTRVYLWVWTFPSVCYVLMHAQNLCFKKHFIYFKTEFYVVQAGLALALYQHRWPWTYDPSASTSQILGSEPWTAVHSSWDAGVDRAQGSMYAQQTLWPLSYGVFFQPVLPF